MPVFNRLLFPEISHSHCCISLKLYEIYTEIYFQLSYYMHTDVTLYLEDTTYAPKVGEISLRHR